MFKSVITTDEMIIADPHVVCVSHSNVGSSAMDFTRAKFFLYRNAVGTVGFSETIYGSSVFEQYSYIFFEDEADLLIFLLKLPGITKRTQMWKKSGRFTFYQPERQTQLS